MGVDGKNGLCKGFDCTPQLNVSWSLPEAIRGPLLLSPFPTRGKGIVCLPKAPDA